MDTLYICATAPTRERSRAHGLLTTLARAGHTVTLVFIDRAGTTFDGLSDHCARIVAVRGGAQLAAAVRAELAARPYDLAHVEGPAARFLGGPLPIPTVVDAGSCGAMRRERSARKGGLLVRVGRAAQAARARRCQRAAAALGAWLIVPTSEDAWAWRALSPEPAEITVVPSPVDLERFASPLALRDQAAVLLDLRGLDRAEAVAAMRLARATMDLVWAQRAEVRLTVLGRAPFGAAGRLVGQKRVDFAGAASDPSGHLARATVVLAPVLPGGAATHAPLEAMATGAAVVTLPGLAAEIGAAPGHEIIVASEPTTWAEAILGLLDDAPYRGRVGRAGRRLVELRHGPRPVVAALESVYAAAVGSSMAAWRLEVGLETVRANEP